MSQFPPQSPPPPPPPPPGGGVPVGGGSQPADGPTAIKYGWEKFQQNWQVIIAALIIGFVAIVALGLIGFLIQRSLTSVDSCTVTNTGNGIRISGGCNDDTPGFFTQIFAAGIFQVLYYLGTMVLQLFIIRATLMIVRGERLEASKVMSTENLGNYILTGLLVAVMTFVGLVLCVIPGLLVIFFTLFWGYFVVDKDMKPIEAITASFNLVKDNAAAVIIFLLLSWLVTLVGFIVCLVGLIVALPVVIIATGYMYKRLQGEPVAA